MSLLTLLYVMTIAISIAVAVLLVHLSKQSSQAPVKIDKEKKSSGLLVSQDIVARETSVLKEIGPLIGSSNRREEIGRKIEDIFSKELEKRVKLVNQELSKKYETIIKERSQSEEVAWQKYKRVFSEKKETEAVVHNLAEGIVVVDGQGKVVMLNPAAEKLLGVSKKDKIGESILENMKEEQLVSLVRTSSNQKDREIEVVSPHDETKKILRASTAVVENENGQTVGMISILSDVTKQKELDKLKSDFVANVTHELRTPLVAIEKSIYLLVHENTGPFTETQQQFLDIVQRNIKRLSHLINDFLDLSRLEAGRLKLCCMPLQIDKIINESVETLSLWAKTKSIKIEKKIEAEIPEVEVDPDRMSQILVNLIGNAIKFTPKDGMVAVEAKLLKENDHVQVSVIDTGIGLDKKDLRRVFDKFYQVSVGSVSDISGTGIGLSVSKELVELHGGKIWAESEKGQGAKFIFVFPVKRLNPATEGQKYG